jgi:DNA-binding transcriptional LysR family regulator
VIIDIERPLRPHDNPPARPCEAVADDAAPRNTAADGVRPRAVLRSADEERCAAAVLAGLGVSLMPRSLLRPGLAAAEIREVALERRVMLRWRPDVDDGLLAVLRDTAASHPGQAAPAAGTTAWTLRAKALRACVERAVIPSEARDLLLIPKGPSLRSG